MSKGSISVFFAIIHQQQKTRFLHVHLSARPCSEPSMSLFRNVLVININAMKGTKIVIHTDDTRVLQYQSDDQKSIKTTEGQMPMDYLEIPEPRLLRGSWI